LPYLEEESFERVPRVNEWIGEKRRRFDLMIDGPNFKGQYFRKRGDFIISPAKEGAFNKLVRYHMRRGKHLQSASACLGALSQIYAIILARPSLATFNELGGYSPLAGELLQSYQYYNPHELCK
jgi:hypothetical protein